MTSSHHQADLGAPLPDEVERVTEAIMEHLGSCDLESGLTVVCGLAGHFVAAMSEGELHKARSHARSLADNIYKAALAKMLHDNQTDS